MASASCDNCGHEWELRKHPSNYARGGPSCPDCGSTRVDLEDDNGGGQRSTALANETTVDAGVEPASAGAGVADTLYVLTNFDEMPADVRRETVSQGASFLGGILNRWLDRREADLRRQEARAKNANLEPVEELPRCPGHPGDDGECGYQFSVDELKTDETRCPECSTLFRVQLAEA